ncbi:hypothetical protein ABE142_26465 [Paenibacillus alvei]|uniref:hypothetical protein n=1 Tax=Paenibacillus alvei TaxID=44250 RepID=UPI003D26E38B
METEVFVLAVSRYSFPDKQTGEIIEGTKVHYVERNAQNEDNLVGFNPTTANMPYDYFEKMSHVPGVYKASIEISLSGRKPSLKITGFKYVAPAIIDVKKAV